MRVFETIVVMLAIAAGALYGELVQVEQSRLFAGACALSAFLLAAILAFHACAFVFSLDVEPEDD